MGQGLGLSVLRWGRVRSGFRVWVFGFRLLGLSAFRFGPCLRRTQNASCDQHVPSVSGLVIIGSQGLGC